MSKSLHMKKTKKRLLLASSLVVAVSALGFAGYKISTNIGGANATTALLSSSSSLKLANEDTLANQDIYEVKPRIMDRAELLSTADIILNKNLISYGASPLAQYDLRDEGIVSRQENQGSEGLCWAYSSTTAIETIIAKNSNNTIKPELSPKHLDYLMVDSDQAYIDPESGENDFANNLNASMQKYAQSFGEISEDRTLGDGNTQIGVMLALQNPLSLTSENDFWQKMKINDSGLSSYSAYSSLITDENATALLDERGHYIKKQQYNAVNDKNAVDYAVADAIELSFPVYTGGSLVSETNSSTKEELISIIKNLISTYGPVITMNRVGFTNENCSYAVYDEVKERVNYIFIDRTDLTQITKELAYPCRAGGHAMTIIGWDDNLTYQENGVNKTGAFLLQNSWGDTNIFTIDGQGHRAELPTDYYLSYSSALDVITIDSVVSKNDYDHIYDIKDYSLEDSNDNEMIFDFPNSGHEKIDFITFSTPFTSGEYNIMIETDNGATAVNMEPMELGQGVNKILLSKEVNDGFTISIRNTTEDFTEWEKLANALVVYTTDVTEEPVPTTATITINSNNESYGTVSPSSLTVPVGTAYTVNGNKIIFGSGESAQTVTATPKAATTDNTFAFSSWNVASGTVSENMTITATFTATPVRPNPTPTPGPIDDEEDESDDEEIPDVPDTGKNSKVMNFIKDNAFFAVGGFGAIIALSVVCSRRKSHNLRRLWK